MYSSDDIKYFQEIIDSSDPFLTEVLSTKTDVEIEKYLTRLIQEKETIPSSNVDWMERHNSIIKTASAMLNMKKAMKQDDATGGVSVT